MMSLLGRLRTLVDDPPPVHAFEISANGIAWSVEGRTGFEPLPEGVLHINPLSDNVLDIGALTSAILRIAPPPMNSKRRRPCAVILPDYSSRLTVLDFDSIPAKEEDQSSLIRFRVKKTLPFDPDSAVLRFQPQTVDKRQEVVVVAISLEIVSRYEAAFRGAGFHPGFMTVQSLAMLDLPETKSDGTALIARLDGRILTMTVIDQGAARLIRCVQIEPSAQEVTSVVIPTAAFVEDEFGSRVSHVVACGLEDLAVEWPEGAEVSHLGAAHQNAGLAGYLHAISR